MPALKQIACPVCLKRFEYNYYMTHHVLVECSRKGAVMTEKSSVLHVTQTDKRPTMPHEPDDMTVFQSGATRSQDKAHVRYDLISPHALFRIAVVCHNGAKKYSPFNYEKGIPINDILNHAIAHIYKYLSGEESDEDDLAHAFWNLHAAIDMEHRHPTMDHGLRPGHKLSEKWRTPNK